MTARELAQKIAQAMARQEGFDPDHPDRLPVKNNNPGNIWDDLCPGKARRIWPAIPIDSRGFLVFPTLDAGWDLFYNQIERKIKRGLTLQQLIGEWCPPPPKGHENDPLYKGNDYNVYTRNVSLWTGIDPGVNLLYLVTSLSGPITPPSTPPTPTPQAKAGGR